MPEIVEFEGEPALGKLQEAVGGFIEVIPLFTMYKGRACVALCDEEGKIKGKPVNLQATRLWADQLKLATDYADDLLVGDIAIVYGGLK
jgi:hypothetical protein